MHNVALRYIKNLFKALHFHDQMKEEEEDDEDEEGGGGVGDRMNFARNPEEIRQEAERRRQEKMARSGKKYSAPPPQRSDCNL